MDALREVEEALARGEAATLPDEAIQRLMTAAVRAFAAKAEATERQLAPFDQTVTATEAVTAVCAMVRAVDLNMFDVTMWFNRTGGRG